LIEILEYKDLENKVTEVIKQKLYSPWIDIEELWPFIC